MPIDCGRGVLMRLVAAGVLPPFLDGLLLTHLHSDHITDLGGDGVPCAGLDELCLGADAYAQTVIRDDLVKLVPMQRFTDILDYHSTVEQAAQTAARAGIGTLLLTHYVPSMQPGQEDEWRAIAAARFPGTIVLGDDLTAADV